MAAGYWGQSPPSCREVRQVPGHLSPALAPHCWAGQEDALGRPLCPGSPQELGPWRGSQGAGWGQPGAVGNSSLGGSRSWEPHGLRQVVGSPRTTTQELGPCQGPCSRGACLPCLLQDENRSGFLEEEGPVLPKLGLLDVPAVEGRKCIPHRSGPTTIKALPGWGFAEGCPCGDSGATPTPSPGLLSPHSWAEHGGI